MLVMTEMPDGILYAVLQRRGEFNHEKMGPESFPGACQLTVWGGAEEGESPTDAINREVKEEVGLDLYGEIVDLADREFEGFDVSSKNGGVEFVHGGKMVEIYRFEDEKNLKVASGIKLPCQFLKEIRLGPQSGGIRLLKKEELEKVRELKQSDKENGIIDRNVIAMFPDTKSAIENAFQLLSR